LFPPPGRRPRPDAAWQDPIMLRAFLNMWRIPELRNKLLFTLGMLVIYRIGFHIALPGVNQEELARKFSQMGQGGGTGQAVKQLADYFALFTGGNLQQSTVFGLGIMPYISASIIFELLVTVVPSLERLRREGDTGRRKIREYTRYATVALCFIQATLWINLIRGQGMVYPDFANSFGFWVMALLGLTTGTIFLMWLGEQIDEYGIGNGVSLIIMAGILARVPQAVIMVARLASMNITAGSGEIGPGKVIFLIVAFVIVVAATIFITQAQRRIPVQQSKMMRGRRVYGGQRQYLPLRINHGGVMPIIFASSLLMFPMIAFGSLRDAGWRPQFLWALLAESFGFARFPYIVCYIALVYFFSYFWTTVTFQPKEVANNLRDMGSFIPGLRAGKRTADYLETVMVRVTYVGAAFLACIAIVPEVIFNWLNVPYNVASFLGGTGLLIVVSVGLDAINRIEAHLVMRNYSGFLGEQGGRIRGAYGQ
jgi:preprotein translocase subunit SecY